MMGNCAKNGDDFGCSPGQIANIVLLVSSVALFIYLILKDGVKSFKSKAHWIPGDFLVLSALTIQLLNLISTQGQPLSLDDKKIGLVEFWMIHTSRIMLCVVIAYLVPAMANPGAEDFWGKITALGITVFLHVVTELYILLPPGSNTADSYLSRLWPKQQGTSQKLYYILAAVILSSFFMLVLLLACANIAGRGIERIVAHKVPLVLKAHQDHEHHHDGGSGGVLTAEEDGFYDSGCERCWRRVEKAAVRAWIVARAYSLEYIIARSVLASAAAIILTSQIGITMAAGLRKSKSLKIERMQDGLRFGITMLQCVFIMVGWSLVLRRWMTAVAYYGTWSSCFKIEDFWTRHLRDLLEAGETEVQQSQLLKAKVDKLVATQSSEISLPWFALYGVIAVQWYTVSFSKTCLFWSLMLFRNTFTDRLLTRVLSMRIKGYDNEKYSEILKGVEMLGETTESLSLSNRRSIPIAAGLFSQGRADGEKNCETLVEFLGRNRSGRGIGLGCFEPNKVQTRLKYLCNNEGGGRSEEEEHFREVMSTKPWKMTAVALMSIIARLCQITATTDNDRPSTSDRPPRKGAAGNCVKAYSEAWDVMDFIEDADPESDRIASEAADKYFRRLEESSEKYREGSVSEALAELKRECKSKTQKKAGCKNTGRPKSKEKAECYSNGWNGSDSIDWKAEAWGTSVYDLCNSIKFSEGSEGSDVNELVKELETCLADIINKCLENIQHVVSVNCRKWAVKSDERRIVKSIYTAGKSSFIMEKLKSSSRAERIGEERAESGIVPV